MSDEDCLIFLNKFKAIPWSKLEIKYNSIFTYLLNRFDDCDNIREAYYRIKHHIYKRPLCPVCNKELQFYRNEKFPITHNGECYKKWKAIINKKVSISKFECENPFQNETVKEKIKHTNLLKYGVENVSQSTYIKKKLSKILSSNEVKNKTYNTKKHNHTFNTSKSEDESYAILKEYYPDVVSQYKDARYPFACDFYIPSLDLFIECNYHWTHGSKPYEGTDDDKQIVEKWKAKGTKFYINAINTWTIRDVNKLNIAKQNKLKIKIFYNIFDFKTWINKIKK